MGEFRFKQFSVDDSACAMKVGTDAVLLGAWADSDGVSSIVDAGCGSGILALMLAQKSHEAKIIAVDISEDACGDALKNIKKSPWHDRIKVRCSDLTNDFPLTSHPLLIISNPPFYNESLKSPDSSRALARHGNDFGVKELIELAAEQLTTVKDTLAFIAPVSRDDEIEFMLSLNRLSPRRICRVFSRIGKAPLRTLWQVGREASDAPRLIREELYIRDRNNNLTADYMQLTSDFYLDK